MHNTRNYEEIKRRKSWTLLINGLVFFHPQKNGIKCVSRWVNFLFWTWINLLNLCLPTDLHFPRQVEGRVRVSDWNWSILAWDEEDIHSQRETKDFVSSLVSLFFQWFLSQTCSEAALFIQSGQKIPNHISLRFWNVNEKLIYSTLLYFLYIFSATSCFMKTII
jgi:hypothetical protein